MIAENMGQRALARKDKRIKVILGILLLVVAPVLFNLGWIGKVVGFDLIGMTAMVYCLWIGFVKKEGDKQIRWTVRILAGLVLIPVLYLTVNFYIDSFGLLMKGSNYLIKKQSAVSNINTTAQGWAVGHGVVLSADPLDVYEEFFASFPLIGKRYEFWIMPRSKVIVSRKELE